MIPNLPIYISLTFLAAVAYTFIVLLQASNQHKRVRWGILIWLVVFGVTALYGFFANTNVTPPRIPLLMVPAIILMVSLFITKRGRAFIDQLDSKLLTWLSIVRIPVEICLLWLFLEGQIPEIMTFEGRNWDIIAGVTAPIIAFLYFNRRLIGNRLFLIWNILGVILLLNIIVHAVLSVPSPIQQFGFEQPNVGILYFPFVWLPSFVASAVLFSHFVLIRKIVNAKGEKL